MIGAALSKSAPVRRIAIALLLAVLAFTAAGCAAEPTEPTVDPQIAPPAIVKSGTLTVGVNLGSAPYATEVAGGGFTGLDVEFATEIAQNLGLAVDFVVVNPDAVTDALTSGSVDIVMSTPAASEETTVVGSYLTVGPALYAAEAVDGEYDGSSTGDEVVAVQQDSPAFWWYTQNRGEDSVKVFGTAAEALEAAASGDTKFAAVDSVVGDYAITADVRVHRVGWVVEPTERGIALLATNAELGEVIGSQYRTLDEAGWIEALVRRWLVPVAEGGDPAGDPAGAPE